MIKALHIVLWQLSIVAAFHKNGKYHQVDFNMMQFFFSIAKFKGADSGSWSNQGVVAVADHHFPTKATKIGNVPIAQQVQL